MLFERLHEGSHRTCFLTDSDIDTIYRLSSLIVAFLVDDRIDSDCRLTCLTVTDDELTLSTTDRDHRVDGFQTRLERLLHGLAVDHTGSLTVERHLEGIGQIDVSLTVDRLS